MCPLRQDFYSSDSPKRVRLYQFLLLDWLFYCKQQIFFPSQKNALCAIFFFFWKKCAQGISFPQNYSSQMWQNVCNRCVFVVVLLQCRHASKPITREDLFPSYPSKKTFFPFCSSSSSHNQKFKIPTSKLLLLLLPFSRRRQRREKTCCRRWLHQTRNCPPPPPASHTRDKRFRKLKKSHQRRREEFRFFPVGQGKLFLLLFGQGHLNGDKKWVVFFLGAYFGCTL